MNNWTDAKEEAIDKGIAGQISEDYCDQGNFLVEWLKTPIHITLKLWHFQKNGNGAGDWRALCEKCFYRIKPS